MFKQSSDFKEESISKTLASLTTKILTVAKHLLIFFILYQFQTP